MAITAENFCHIEDTENGKVLFYVEYDGDDSIVHQIATTDAGLTIDVALTLPSHSLDKLWPDGLQFPVAAAKVLETAANLVAGVV